MVSAQHIFALVIIFRFEISMAKGPMSMQHSADCDFILSMLLMAIAMAAGSVVAENFATITREINRRGIHQMAAQTDDSFLDNRTTCSNDGFNVPTGD
jgi:hypothetical protein